MNRARVGSWIATLAVSALPVLSAQSRSAGMDGRLLAVTRDLRIDATANDLSSIGFMEVVRNGIITISQPQDHLYRFFDAQGKSLGTFGRQGSGPGEFQMMGRQGRVGDTLWVLDPSKHRTTYFTADQKFVRTALWPSSIKRTQRDSVGFVGAFGFPTQASLVDGSVLVPMNHLGTEPPLPAWIVPPGDGRGFARVSATGLFVKLVMWAAALPSRCYVTKGAGPDTQVRVPFCAEPLDDLASDGSRVYSLTQENAEGSGATYHVTVISNRGDTIFARAYPYLPIRIAKRAMDSTIEATATRTGISPERADAIRSVRGPATYPPVRRMFLGRDGTVWLELWRNEPGHRWLELDPKGEPLGVIDLAANVALKVAERDTLWATETDDDGLQSVVRFRVTH